jgi:tRNA threonylcarbamoyladenosine biosynthesis protein TsaE
MIISRNAEETIAIGARFAQVVHGGDVIALDGAIGAGKTHFVQGLARGLGFNGQVTSPTFTLVHEYAGARLPIFHFDFYRLDDPDEVLAIGLDEYLDADGVCVIEWGDKFPALLPPTARWVRIAIKGDQREIVGLEELE